MWRLTLCFDSFFRQAFKHELVMKAVGFFIVLKKQVTVVFVLCRGVGLPRRMA